MKPLNYFIDSNDSNEDLLLAFEGQYGSFGQKLSKSERFLLVYKIAISLVIYYSSDFQDGISQERLNSLVYDLQHSCEATKIGMIKFLMENDFPKP